MNSRKKTVAKKSHLVPKKAGTPKPINVRADLIVTDDTPYYYVNSVEVSVSSNEFVLIGARTPTKLSVEYQNEALDTGKLSIEAAVQLILPINSIPGVIKALQNQKDTYEKLFGQIYSAE